VIVCEASDPNGDELSFEISASVGAVDNDGAGTATWEPLAEGLHEVSCQVDDRNGNVTTDSIEAELQVADGLIGHWQLEGDAEDSTDGSHDGSFIGLASPDFEPDRFGTPGGALVLTGNNSMQVADDDNTFDLGQFTLAAWVSFETSTSNRTIVGKAPDTGFGNYTLHLNGTTAAFPGRSSYNHDFVDGNTGTVASQAALPTGQFVHVAVTYDGNRIDTYLDGVGQLSSSNAPVPLLNDEPLRIGTGIRGAFTGLIDDVRIYDRALSGDEVKALADGTL
jgi:hypothetical protein